jgi:ribonucleotide reductase alpha subunit
LQILQTFGDHEVLFVEVSQLEQKLSQSVGHIGVVRRQDVLVLVSDYVQQLRHIVMSVDKYLDQSVHEQQSQGSRQSNRNHRDYAKLGLVVVGLVGFMQNNYRN